MIIPMAWSRPAATARHNEPGAGEDTDRRDRLTIAGEP
jgi:hypothetical protein